MSLGMRLTKNDPGNGARYEAVAAVVIAPVQVEEKG